jgi:hypothetical protein
MMPDFHNQAILNLRPNSGWGIRGREVEWSSDEFGNTIATNVIWNDTVNPFPTKEELDAELARLQAEWTATEYQRLRKPEYPPLADFADAMYWQAEGDNTKMTAYLAAVAAVKSKYPKE